MREESKGALFVISSMMIFGSMGIFVRSLNVPLQVIIFFSFLVPPIVLFIFFLFKDKKALLVRKYIGIIVITGILNIATNYFYFEAYIKTTISNAVLTHYTAPIFVALFAPLFLKEKIQRNTLYALLISIIGIVIITYKDFSLSSSDLEGILYGLASGITYGLLIIAIKFLSGYFSIFTIHIYQSFAGAFIISPFFVSSSFLLSRDTVYLLILFAIIFGIAGPLTYFSGIKRMKSQHASILAYSEIIFAIIFAFVFFKELPLFSSIIGGMMIILAGIIVLRGEKNAKKA